MISYHSFATHSQCKVLNTVDGVSDCIIARDNENNFFNFFHIIVDRIPREEFSRLQILHDHHHKRRPLRILPRVVLGLKFKIERVVLKEQKVRFELVEEIIEQEVLVDLQKLTLSNLVNLHSLLCF